MKKILDEKCLFIAIDNGSPVNLENFKGEFFYSFQATIPYRK